MTSLSGTGSGAGPPPGLAGYLRRLGLESTPAPTWETLLDLHHRHLDRVPFDNLDIMLRRPPSPDPAASLARLAEGGRGGYCFHHNGALELALSALGFDVERWHGQVWREPGELGAPLLNHLLLVVSGLPTTDHADGRWWVDVGLGGGFREPLPLREGTHRQGGFDYRLGAVEARGWDLEVQPGGGFRGVRVTRSPVGPAEVGAAHRWLSTPPDGSFTRLLVVQRRGDEALETLRGCLLTRTTAAGATVIELTTYDEWRAALDATGIALHDVDDGALRDLFTRMWRLHPEQQPVLDRPVSDG